MPVLSLAIDANNAKKGARDFSQAADVVKSAAKQAKAVLLELAAVAGVALTFKHAYDEIIKFDVAIQGLKKTTGLQGRALDDMTASILGLSRRLPMAADELAKIGEVAGRLGIRGRQNLIDFIDPIARLSIDTEEAAGGLATGLGQLITITGEGAKSIAPLAFILQELADNSAAAAGEILHAGGAIARAGSSFHATAAESMALAAVVAQVGGRIEFTGQAIGDTMDTLQSQISRGGPQLEAFLSLTGKTREELASMFRDSPLEAFQVFLDSLHKLNADGGDVVEMLKLMDLGSDQLLKILPALAKNSDKVAEALQRARDGMKELKTIEVPDTFTNQLKIIGNGLDALVLQMVGENGVLADFKKMLKGMTNALAGEDPGLAMRILWTTIKLEWERGIIFLENQWARFGGSISTAWAEFEPVLKDLGTRIVETLGVIGANAGAAMWTGIKNGMAAASINSNAWVERSAAYTFQNTFPNGAPGDKRSADEVHAAYRQEIADIEKRRSEALAKTSSTPELTEDMLREFKTIWDKPLPSVNTEAITSAITSARDLSAEQKSTLDLLTKERDELIAISKSVADPSSFYKLYAPTNYFADTQDFFAGFNKQSSQHGSGKPSSAAASASATVTLAPPGMNQMMQDVQDEMDALAMMSKNINMTKEEAITLIQAQRDAMAFFKNDTDKATAAVGKLKESLDKLESVRKLETIANGIGDAFSGAFSDMIMGAKSAKEAMLELGSEILRVIEYNLIAKPIGDAISASIVGIGLPFLAQGGVFDQSGMTAFARGGIVSQPTIFPFANGTGLMGEAGPEAIMPLQRDGAGNLGVRSSGSGGSDVVVNVINNTSSSVKTKETSDSMGNKKIEVVIGEIVSNDIRNRGPIGRTMETIYGARRSGGSR